jgi:hypothetical protein
MLTYIISPFTTKKRSKVLGHYTLTMNLQYYWPTTAALFGFKQNKEPKRWIVLLLFLVTFPNQWVNAQKIVTESGEYKMRIEKSMSELDAEKICIERARINAIENAFGVTVIQGNSTYIKNERTGTSSESKNVFNMMAETMVNGEWIEDIKPPSIEKLFEEDSWWMEVKVVGKIREIKEVPVNFKSYVLSCPETQCKTNTFNDKQSIYLEFTAPEDGYIAVFCDVPEEKTTFRMLPYKVDKMLGSYPVQADKKYIFFDPSNAGSIPKVKVDEFVFYLSKPETPEISKIFVLYRPKVEIGKPLLQQQETTNRQQLEIPLSLSSEDFQRWLQKLRMAEKEIQLESTVISIIP